MLYIIQRRYGRAAAAGGGNAVKRLAEAATVTRDRHRVATEADRQRQHRPQEGQQHAAGQQRS